MRSGVATIIAKLCVLAYCTVSHAATDVKFAYIGDPLATAYMGAQQGLTEANLQGQFLGQKYSLIGYQVEQWQSSDLSGFIAILVVANKEMLVEVSSAYPNTPIFNLLSADDALRAECHNNLLHVTPSQKMLDDALAQWKKKQPDTTAIPQAWHHDFKKFAARDLNKRFLHNQKTKMDSLGWAGWAAVKMTSDAVAREKLAQPAELLGHLKNELSFDGQKGANLDFRKTGQLRQLILLIDKGKIVAEAPIRGVAKPHTLDSLGILDCK